MTQGKTLAYIRVSTKEQSEHGSSIQNQKERIAEYCRYHNLQEPIFFADEGISGKKQKNRPAFQQMTKLINQENVSCIVILSLSRLGRNTIETPSFIQTLEKKSIALHSISEKLDTASAMGRFFVTVMAALCTLESEQTGERTKSVTDGKKSKLEPYCPTPYGFKVVGRTFDQDGKLTNAGNLIPDDHEKEIVKTIFSRNTYPAEIQNFLNEQGIKPKRADKWSSPSIKKILKNKAIYQQAGII